MPNAKPLFVSTIRVEAAVLGRTEMLSRSDCCDGCPLPDALLSLLRACAESGSLHDKALAERLCQSPETVHTNFKRINELLGTHERFAAVRMACREGWISPFDFMPAPPPPRRLKSMMPRHRNFCC